LKITGNELLLFDSKVNQKVLSFFDESMLLEVVSDWTGSSQDVSELTAVLGIPDEQLPSWVTNLAMWVSEDEITLVDMIVSIEHLINN
jgi:succinate dehydrogenase flavin-adding protein (antitoxin of CptAB toxin-antitoxin module)